MHDTTQNRPPPVTPGSGRFSDDGGRAADQSAVAQEGRHMRRKWIWAAVAVIFVGAAGSGFWLHERDLSAKTRVARAQVPAAVPVTIGTSVRKDVPVYLSGLSTVQAFNTVTVHVRVDGQLMRIHFIEGQEVKKG